jgi:hypothetical protein
MFCQTERIGSGAIVGSPFILDPTCLISARELFASARDGSSGEVLSGAPYGSVDVIAVIRVAFAVSANYRSSSSVLLPRSGRYKHAASWRVLEGLD